MKLFTAFALMLCATAAGAIDDVNYNEIYTQEELKSCGWRIRTPTLVQTAHAIHTIGRCCGANLCTSKSHKCIGHGKSEHCWPPKQAGDDDAQWSAVDVGGADDRLADDNSFSTTVMKSSFDGGITWGNFQVLSPKGGIGYSCSHAIYDRVRETLVLQYHHFGTNTTRPATKVKTFQMFSTDDGQSWTWPEDISAQIAGCSVSKDDMMYQSAGSRIQTHTGRMLWPAHSFEGHACVWYSDDGGKTYNVSNIIDGNEISVAELKDADAPDGYKILMNGRHCKGCAWGMDHRARYWSSDDGAHFGPPEESPLLTDDGRGCERTLINVDGVLYSSEPQGPERTQMVLQCSKDGGKTWPKSQMHTVNGDNVGAYSAILGVKGGGILMVWENDKGNQVSGIIGTDWC